MSKRILVTGVGGFAGSHFLEHVLVSTDWHVVGLASFRSQGKVERILDSEHYQANRHRVEVHAHDLSFPVSAVLRSRVGDVDFVVNYASDSHVDRSIASPAPFVENNVRLAVNILELVRDLRPLAFVQVGTDEEFGPAILNERHDEWAPTTPSNPYAASKAAQSALAIAYWRTYDLPIVLTQTMNLIGERQDPEKFVPMCMRRILKGETVTIHGREGHIGSRFYLHARNQADAILFLLNHTTPIRYSEANLVRKPDRYNIVGEQEIDNLSMARLISEILSRELRYELVDFHAARPGHDRRYALDGRKLDRIGWTPRVPFKRSLERLVRWTAEHPEWLESRHR